MRLAWFLLAASSLHFEITDARGKKPGGVAVEAGNADADGWCSLSVVSKGKGEFVLLWPYDGKAKTPDGPGDVPAIVVEKGDGRVGSNTHVLAAWEAGVLLGVTHDVGITVSAAGLANSEDVFAKGVGLLAAGKASDAVEPLGRALKERERQLTRVPSEIYPVAILYGHALFGAGKYDDAAVAYLKALQQRPSDLAARRARAAALIKAGKPDAAETP
jgi:tetratricopeptide (TPR) repeat protein